MIQRVQTFFLFLTSLAMLMSVLTPLAYLTFNQQEVVFEGLGFYQNQTIIYSTWGLFLIGAISSVLALITIFLFKNRVLQIRLSIFNIFLMIGFYLFAGFLLFMRNPQADITFEKIGVGLIMPLISIILTWLAIRKIGADEALVRSLNRLRR